MEYFNLTQLPVSLRLKRALEDVLVQLGESTKATDVIKFSTMLSEVLKRWQTPLKDRETLVRLAEELSPKDIDSLTILSKLLISRAELGPEISHLHQKERKLKPLTLSSKKDRPFQTELEDRLERIETSLTKLLNAGKNPDQTKVTFTDTVIKVKGKGEPMNKTTSPLILAEHVILKERIHYFWAFVILPEFEVDNADKQFRTYISEAKRKFKKYGIDKIHLHTTKKKYTDGFGVFDSIDDHIDSNIKHVKNVYKKARFEYENGKRSQAIKILSEITKDNNNKLYLFTNAYIDLADWIDRQNFKNVSDSLIRCCTDFLEWYHKQLDVGILGINKYLKKKGGGTKSQLSPDSKTAFNAIKEEFKQAKRLYIAFINNQKLSQEEKDYKNLIEDLYNYLKILDKIQKETIYDYEDDFIINTIKKLCNSNSTLAEVIEYGLDNIDPMFPPDIRTQVPTAIMNDLREDSIYLYLAEVIEGLGISYFSEFERVVRGNRSELLEHIKWDIAHRLQKKLAREISQKISRFRKRR